MDQPSSRNREFRLSFQFIGKILNVERLAWIKSLQTERESSLFTAMGTGFGAEFDVTKARYQKHSF